MHGILGREVIFVATDASYETNFQQSQATQLKLSGKWSGPAPRDACQIEPEVITGSQGADAAGQFVEAYPACVRWQCCTERNLQV